MYVECKILNSWSGRCVECESGKSLRNMKGRKVTGEGVSQQGVPFPLVFTKSRAYCIRTI